MLLLVIFSPLGLRALARSLDLNWLVLSNVGQTYSAVSALITALALGGVAISLWYQARDVSATRSQAARTFHFELLHMELEDEELMRASGAPWGLAIPADFKSLRVHIFAHMWVSFWESQYILGEMPEELVKASALELFGGKVGREYWQATGAQNFSSAKGRRLKFYEIVNEEYKNAIELPPIAWDEDQKPYTGKIETIKKRCVNGASICIAAAAIGLTAERILNKKALIDAGHSISHGQSFKD